MLGLLFKNVGRKQTILKNTFWLSISEMVNKGLLAVLLISIIRYLGAEKYGQFNFAFAFVIFFSVVADFGLTTLTIMNVAKNIHLGKKYIDNIIVIKLILGALSLGLIVFFSGYFQESQEIKTLVYLAGIWMIGQSFLTFFQAVFRAFEKMEYEALSKFIYAAVLLSLVFSLMYLKLGPVFLMQGYLFASVITIIIVLFLISGKFTKFWLEMDFSFWKSLFKESWPLALFTVFALLYFQISIIILHAVKTDLDVGLYSIAFNSVTAVLLLAEVIAASFFPSLSKMDDKKTIIKKALFLIACLGLFISVFLFFGADSLIKLLYGGQALPAARAFKIMVWILPLGFMNQILAIFLIASGLQKKRLKAAIICAVFSILTNLILIPKLGFIGAALAALFSEIVLFATYFYFYRSVIATESDPKKIEDIIIHLKKNKTTAPVSVVIPCYNNEDTIEKAMLSAINQSWRPAEIIVINDASEDRSPEIIDKTMRSFGKDWIKTINLDVNQGPSAARNIGWEKSSESYVAFLDADDEWNQDKIAIQMHYLLENKEINVCGHKYLLNNRKNYDFSNFLYSDIKIKDIPARKWLFRNYYSVPCVIIKRELPYRFPAFKRYCEDYFLWLQIAFCGNKMILIDIPLAHGNKSYFGERGLSKNFWKMATAHFKIFPELFLQGKITFFAMLVVLFWSLLKYARRATINYFWTAYYGIKKN